MSFLLCEYLVVASLSPTDVKMSSSHAIVTVLILKDLLYVASTSIFCEFYLPNAQ